MKVSLWHTQKDDWAVCEGPGSTQVKGYIHLDEDGWKVAGDPTNATYLDPESAASAVVNEAVSGTAEYVLSKDGKNTIVRTYQEVVESLTKDGWTVISRPISN